MRYKSSLKLVTKQNLTIYELSHFKIEHLYLTDTSEQDCQNIRFTNNALLIEDFEKMTSYGNLE